MPPSSSVPSACVSLDQVHSSVEVQVHSRWRRLIAYAGPALLISIGYMDPGNWATDLEGGAVFGYQLLWVLVMANWMAILLQSLSARLGIVTGRDLAQACREGFPRPAVLALWVLAELAIIACDLAELLGSAIALKLLFRVPLMLGVLITAIDVFVFLAFQRYGIRKLEAVILTLVLTIFVCFLIEIGLVSPDWMAMGIGMVPRIDSGNLYVAIAILGATVMPHNLYLHSALVQTRHVGANDTAKRQAIRYNLLDTTIALHVALLVNAAILIVAAAVFGARGLPVTDIAQAQRLLAPLLGTTLASFAFAIALLCAGHSSTVTGTLAGQIVMEGLLRVRIAPLLRRILTRGFAIVPAFAALAYAGEHAALKLLVLSQVILSLQLPFAVIPLIRLVSDPRRMGKFAIGPRTRRAAWAVTLAIIALNAWLVLQTVGSWGAEVRTHTFWWSAFGVAVLILLLLAWIGVTPLMPHTHARRPATQSKCRVTPRRLPAVIRSRACGQRLG